MVEEFHGERTAEPWRYKLLYGWGTLHINVWLPSLKEMVGITGEEHGEWGSYCSAMQGLNTSNVNYVDPKGGDQFLYFQQYNTSGGGIRIWNACAQEQTWLRSSYAVVSEYSWIISGVNTFNAYDAFPLTAPHAVHPAVSSMQVAYRSLPPKRQGESSFITLHLLSPKRHARIG